MNRKAGGNNFTIVTFQESDGRAAHQIEASTVERDTYLLVWCWMMIGMFGCNVHSRSGTNDVSNKSASADFARQVEGDVHVQIHANRYFRGVP